MSSKSKYTRKGVLIKLSLAIFILCAFFFTTFLSRLIFDFFKNISYRPSEDASCLYIKLSGNYREIPGYYPVDLISENNDMTLEDIIQAIRKARNDEQIQTIFLEIHTIDNGWSSISDIRKEIELFRKKGKRVFAYLYGVSDKEYYLASAADSIFLSPTGSLFINGLSATVMFYSGLSDKLGIRWEVFSRGDYKSAPNVLTDSSLSPASREDLENILFSIHENYVSEVQKSRDKLFLPFNEILDSGPYLSAAKALSLNLVDGLESYENLIYSLNLRDASINPRKYLSQDINAFSREKPVCVIFIEGEISYGDNSLIGSYDSQDARSIAEYIIKIAEDENIKAVVIRINSPGGDLDASFAIAKAVQYASSRKPVVISMGDVSASGGYFISMYGNVIVCSEFTITGSIGVFMVKPDFSGLLLKTGLSVDTVKTNLSSDFMSVYRQLSDREAQILHSYADEAYILFTSEVSKTRGLDSAFVESIAGGRIWTGTQACEIGLADTIGGLAAAVSIAKDLADIPIETSIGIEIYPEPTLNLKNLKRRAWLKIAKDIFPEGYEIVFHNSLQIFFMFPYKVDIR